MGSSGPYNQHFSFPHRLTLRSTDDGIRMFAKPIKEIENLRAKSTKAEPRELISDKPAKLSIGSDLLDVRLALKLATATAIEVKLPGRTVRYDVKAKQLGGTSLEPVDGKITIQILADRSLTEVIGNDGRVYISGRGPARQKATEVSVTAHGGNARLLTLEAHELKSIWEK